MSKWTANRRAGVLKRTVEYDAFVRGEWKRKQIGLVKLNWKAEQIEKVKRVRAIAARVKSRQGDNPEVVPKTAAYPGKTA